MNSHTTPFFKVVKLWARSGSLQFGKDSLKRTGGERVASILWKERPFFYRPSTDDTDLINRILLKSSNKAEYRFPRDLKPQCILDIGANIGATSRLLREYYPEASILSFEPHPGNFELLRKNTEGDPKTQAFNLALGRENTQCNLILEDQDSNLGGFSLHSFGNQANSSVAVTVKHSGQFLESLGIKKVDFIKIDTEGSESDILFSLPEQILARVSWICGELHGVNDFALLNHLSRWFNIGIRKSWWNRLSHFEACRKDLDLFRF